MYAIPPPPGQFPHPLYSPEFSQVQWYVYKLFITLLLARCVFRVVTSGFYRLVEK